MNDHDSIFAALRGFIMSLLPGVEVVQGLVNLVSAPEGPHVRMTPAGMRRLRTNQDTYDFTGTRTVERSEEFAVQLDFYGPTAGDWATTIETLFRDPYACDMLAPVCAPLYCTDPHQAPLINGEENYEQRFIITALIQYNPSVTLPQDYADTLAATLISVDETFKP